MEPLLTDTNEYCRAFLARRRGAGSLTARDEG
jgi:hypothetical protein